MNESHNLLCQNRVCDHCRYLVRIVATLVCIKFFSLSLWAAEVGSQTTHSLNRFCWPETVNGPLGKPQDTIQDLPSQLSLKGTQAELRLMLRPSAQGPLCKKTFEGTLFKHPTRIVFTSKVSNCKDDAGVKQRLEEPIILMNSVSDETNGRMFWVDDQKITRELGNCPNSFLMFRMTPIILPDFLLTDAGSPLRVLPSRQHVYCAS